MFPQSKFHAPPARAEHIERPALLAALGARPLRAVVVSAPAGFGKTTLLARWTAHHARGRVAWITLDPDDRGRRLWLAVLTALRPLVGAALDPVLDAAETAADDDDLRRGVLIELVDALAATVEPVTLVLDDVHHAAADAPTHDTLDWFLTHLPPQHAVALATRRDLGLAALSRMRAHGEVLDVRADDLRFAAPELHTLLHDAFGVAVDGDVIAALEHRTEGWPAAAYLAALRLRLGDAAAAVLRQLRASDEDLIGDLVDEVLRSSPAHERRFVLETSVLRRFNLDLCVRLLGDSDATRCAFRSLTQSSLLLSPVDGSRAWFRTHPLLREVLYRRLVAADAPLARRLHTRAGAWFESEGGEAELDDAMAHYVAAGDWDPAAELLACHSIRFVQSGALGGRAREWTAAVPRAAVVADARLCYVTAVLSALSGDREGRDRWLATGAAAGWVGPMPDGTASYGLAALSLEGMLCFDDLGGAVVAARRALAALPTGSPMRAAVEALTAWHLHLLGEDAQAEQLAHRVLADDLHLPSAGLPLARYLPRAVLGLAALRRGELATADALVTAAVDARDDGPLRTSPHALPVTYARARLLTLAGRADEAATCCQAGLAAARGWRDSSFVVPAVLLEQARALAVLGDGVGARAARDRARGQIAGAADPGLLADALAAVVEEPLALVRGAADRLAAEDLSGRQVEVLRALAGGGSLREVADELFISRNTMKTHTRALYAKLGVGTRAEAVARAAALGLLADPAPASARSEVRA